MFGNLYRFVLKIHPKAQIAVNIIQIKSPNENAFKKAVSQLNCGPTIDPFRSSWYSGNPLNKEIEIVLKSFAASQYPDLDIMATNFNFAHGFLLGERKKTLKHILNNGSLLRALNEQMQRRENFHKIRVYLPTRMNPTHTSLDMMPHLLMENKCNSLDDLQSVLCTSSMALERVLQGTHDQDGDAMETLQVTMVCGTLGSRIKQRSLAARGYNNIDKCKDQNDEDFEYSDDEIEVSRNWRRRRLCYKKSKHFLSKRKQRH